MLLLFCIIQYKCKEGDLNIPVKYENYSPRYDLIQLHVANDTLHFKLDENTYNEIKSFNVFKHNEVEYISFYDRRSESVNIYNWDSKNLIKKVFLKECFPEDQLYKTSVYCKSFDSIYVTNKTKLYLLDTARKIKRSISFVKKPRFAWAAFDNTTPPVFKGNYLYMGVRPYVKETSLQALKEWKVLYRFDMINNKSELVYHLPEMYRSDYYGYDFLDFSYCSNYEGNIILSFPADTNIYETDLLNKHIAYCGKSQFQKDRIQPVAKDVLKNGDGYKSYLLRDSYGAIYFDPFTKRYLRASKSKISELDYQNKHTKKNQHILIFDQHLRIIGESPIDSGIILNSIFFSSNGSMYARINANDEYGLHFAKLEYKNDYDKLSMNSKAKK
ncbi:DUF4221 family protein [Longitalea luteola]|uniref:DUF4221 family protein n=1 Tax=Longitalea luteola TaxID=2812563 RepID=UPI001A967E87|nr:DUF4221 family protein [Longitalea luteola]